jgi:hypothetical protein
MGYRVKGAKLPIAQAAFPEPKTATSNEAAVNSPNTKSNPATNATQCPAKTLTI